MELHALMKWIVKSEVTMFMEAVGNEASNEDNKFAVAVYQELSIDKKKIVRHLLVEFTRIAAYFIENGGEISGKVTGKGSTLKAHKEEWLFRASCVGHLQTKDMLKNLMHSLLQRESRCFADMDLMFSCMCCD